MVLLAGDEVVQLVHFLVDDTKVGPLQGCLALSLLLLLLLDADDLREDQLVVDEWLTSQTLALFRQRGRRLLRLRGNLCLTMRLQDGLRG